MLFNWGKSPESRRGRQNAIFLEGGGRQPSGRGVRDKETERLEGGRERDGRERSRGACAVCELVFRS
ncbi:hypothetical protein CPAR01_12946 [Colletotrichum paranaense]|uniref:Uncharacterized protein n=3 Tax=Colletotrichum acutatum species complex TaxID=2707335 RepID=A0AAI9U211_9PEZI|nr:uncharacterized protein CPAR01_12946 [Colletotrichum paranaense]KAK1448913.1 hypothetical protein CMEL01_08228 [Colletotrichum melonis]KAK1463791.1 hypothetical protein CCUS01_08205 [Colletotrichum cuscutae]KAK1526418.1 hypothetical protein CPAR01_12946 [Colletotrichum paranaense]